MKKSVILYQKTKKSWDGKVSEYHKEVRYIWFTLYV